MAIGGRVVKVKTAELLTRIRENREKHVSIYEQAVVGYRKRAIEEIERLLYDAHRGNIHHSISLPVPEDHSEDYDRIIDMLEMEVEDEVAISEQEFAWYVRDDWAWKHAFVSSTTGAGYVGDHGEFPARRSGTSA